MLFYAFSNFNYGVFRESNRKRRRDFIESYTKFYSKSDKKLILLSKGEKYTGFYKYYDKDYYEQFRIKYEKIKKEDEQNENNSLYVSTRFFEFWGPDGSNTSHEAKFIINYVKIITLLFYFKLFLFFVLGLYYILLKKRDKEKAKKVKKAIIELLVIFIII